MPGIDDKNETEEDDMEQDTPDSDKSEDDEDSETGSGSDDEESSGEFEATVYVTKTLFFRSQASFDLNCKQHHHFIYFRTLNRLQIYCLGWFAS